MMMVMAATRLKFFFSFIYYHEVRFGASHFPDEKTVSMRCRADQERVPRFELRSPGPPSTQHQEHLINSEGDYEPPTGIPALHTRENSFNMHKSRQGVH